MNTKETDYSTIYINIPFVRHREHFSSIKISVNTVEGNSGYLFLISHNIHRNVCNMQVFEMLQHLTHIVTTRL